MPGDYRRPEANPYVASHRDFGPELLTADAAFGVDRDWATLFGRAAPLHVEIGSGNGFFLSELAIRNPDINVLGIEIRYKRTVLCGRKLREAGVSNARIARYHAAFLDDLFEPGAIDVLWVHHPDPWPKEKHEKNRLISRWFLEDVARLVMPGGFFRLKSDFEPNVTRAAHLIDHGPDDEPLPRLPFVVTGRSEDVNTGPAPWPDDIETNYQRKFKRKGEPVYAVELRRDATP
ncbi:MAG: tRNA (guanosine(46)-N7)-methyltransferase TrmB [Myxococcota bacterium]